MPQHTLREARKGHESRCRGESRPFGPANDAESAILSASPGVNNPNPGKRIGIFLPMRRFATRQGEAMKERLVCGSDQLELCGWILEYALLEQRLNFGFR